MIKPSGWLLTYLLTRYRYGGVTMPWGTAYILPSRITEPGLRAHEQVHLDQITRLGGVTWAVSYLWFNYKYGYHMNPYEVEARLLSGTA